MKFQRSFSICLHCTPAISLPFLLRIYSVNLWVLPFVFAVFLGGLFAPTARASSGVVIGWNQSPDPYVVGYKVYYGTVSQTYTNVVVLGISTNALISDLTTGTIYYFAVTSYDASGQESVYSSEVSYTAPPVIETLISPTYAAAAGQFSLEVGGSSGSEYVVEASTDLVDWVPLETNTAPFIFVDPDAANFTQRFYQALPLPTGSP